MLVLKVSKLLLLRQILGLKSKTHQVFFNTNNVFEVRQYHVFCTQPSYGGQSTVRTYNQVNFNTVFELH